MNFTGKPDDFLKLLTKHAGRPDFLGNNFV